MCVCSAKEKETYLYQYAFTQARRAMLVSGGKVRERQRQRAQQLRADAMQETGGLLHSPQSRAPAESSSDTSSTISVPGVLWM